MYTVDIWYIYVCVYIYIHIYIYIYGKIYNIDYYEITNVFACLPPIDKHDLYELYTKIKA